MKRALIFVSLVFSFSTSFGQKYSVSIDQATKKYIGQLPKQQQYMFNAILAKRQTTGWLKRVETTSFDYAFIEETFCYYNKTAYVDERYFVKEDTIPHYIFFNGKPGDTAKFYDDFLGWYTKNVTYHYTLRPMIESYSQLKSVQELPYNKRQIWPHGCVVQEGREAEFKKERTAELKNTWQIQIMIDKIQNKIIVSVQTAPQQPEFETYSYNAVWDW